MTLFDKFARLANDVLLNLFPRTTITNGRKAVLSSYAGAVLGRAVTSPRITRPRVDYFAAMPPRSSPSPRRKPLSFTEEAKSSSPVSPTCRPRRNPIRVLQAEKNSHNLSLERPLKSCFRKCRANETFGLPSNVLLPNRQSTLGPERRVVFNTPINDGGNSPCQASIAFADASQDMDEEAFAIPKFSLSRPCPRPWTAQLSSSPCCTPIENDTSLSLDSRLRRPTAAPSRLRTPPMAGARRRSVAYSF